MGSGCLFSLIKFFQTTSLLNRGRYDYLRKRYTCHTRNDGSCTPDTILEVCLFLFIETEFSKNLARLAQTMRPVLTEEVISNSNTTWDLNTDTKADTETTCIHILSLQWHIQNVNFIVTDFPRK
jgi:hypothetical protein